MKPETMPTVGTVYLAPNGYLYRLRSYDNDPWCDPPIEEAIIPAWDIWTARGGATSGPNGWDTLPDGSLPVVIPNSGRTYVTEYVVRGTDHNGIEGDAESTRVFGSDHQTVPERATDLLAFWKRHSSWKDLYLVRRTTVTVISDERVEA